MSSDYYRPAEASEHLRCATMDCRNLVEFVREHRFGRDLVAIGFYPVCEPCRKRIESFENA